MKLLRKAQVGGLQGFILSIVTVAIVLAIGLIVLSELQTAEGTADWCPSIGSTGMSLNTTNDTCYNTTNSSALNTVSPAFTPSYNATGSIITKLGTVPTWIGIIIIVALAFIVLSFFIGRRQ